MNNPSITVLIPVYNPSIIYLKQCLDSCFFQSLDHSEYEVLLCFDGLPSTPVLSLLATYNHFSNYRHIISPSHVGLRDILNLGILNSLGRFIARIDSDDFMDYYRLQTQHEFLLDNPSIFCVGTSLKLVDSKSNPIGLRTYPSSTFLLNLLGLFANPIAHPSVMFDKSFLSDQNPYLFPSPYEDYHLWSRYSGSIVNLPQYLTYYRIHSSQISSTRRLSYLTFLMIRFNFSRYFLDLTRPHYLLLFLILIPFILIPHPRTLRILND